MIKFDESIKKYIRKANESHPSSRLTGAVHKNLFFKIFLIAKLDQSSSERFTCISYSDRQKIFDSTNHARFLRLVFLGLLSSTVLVDIHGWVIVLKRI